MARCSVSAPYRGTTPTALAILVEVFCMELHFRARSHWPVPPGRPADLLDLTRYEQDFQSWKRTNPIAHRLVGIHRNELRRIGYELDEE